MGRKAKAYFGHARGIDRFTKWKGDANTMKKFYFTFGLGHENNNRYQVIFAKNEPEAYERMHKLHGRQWAFCYNQEQWSATRQEGYFDNLKPLENQYAI